DTLLPLAGCERLVPVPEPSAILGLLALGTLGAASTLKRQLKPSKSTEKATTKVG
ncbi:MAG: PEP-CTERM sorting domain-containing protein, partial [Microcystis aeruginosa]